jgi:hypothetical protein
VKVPPISAPTRSRRPVLAMVLLSPRGWQRCPPMFRQSDPAAATHAVSACATQDRLGACGPDPRSPPFHRALRGSPSPHAVLAADVRRGMLLDTPPATIAQGQARGSSRHAGKVRLSRRSEFPATITCESASLAQQRQNSLRLGDRSEIRSSPLSSSAPRPGSSPPEMPADGCGWAKEIQYCGDCCIKR